MHQVSQHGGEQAMIQLSTPQIVTLPFPLYIVGICIEEITFAEMDVTAVKALL